MNKIPLVIFALFLPLAFGAWQWSRTLGERLGQPQPLHFKAVKGSTIASVKFTPPLTDAFTVTVGDLSQYKKGYESEEWKVERLQFRPATTGNWKTLPESFWRPNWGFLAPRTFDPPTDGERKRVYSVFSGFSGSFIREMLTGHYQMRARLSQEFHDDTSGVRYLGTQRFDFTFHVNSAPEGEKRVVLDSLKTVAK